MSPPALTNERMRANSPTSNHVPCFAQTSTTMPLTFPKFRLNIRSRQNGNIRDRIMDWIGGTQPVRRLDFHVLMPMDHRGQHVICDELAAASSTVEDGPVLVGKGVEFTTLAAWTCGSDTLVNADGFKSKLRAAAHAMLRLRHVHREAVAAANRCNRTSTIVADSRRFADEASAGRAFIGSGGEHAPRGTSASFSGQDRPSTRASPRKLLCRHPDPSARSGRRSEPRT